MHDIPPSASQTNGEGPVAINVPSLGDEEPIPIVEGASSPVPPPTTAWLNDRLRGAIASFEEGKRHVEEIDREQAAMNRQLNEAKGVALRGLARLEGMIALLQEQGARVEEPASPADGTIERTP
jgi:hypothetical protein